MFGIRFIKVTADHLPDAVPRRRRGARGRRPVGFYYAPVDLAGGGADRQPRRRLHLRAGDARDFQAVTVQGQVTYRVGEPQAGRRDAQFRARSGRPELRVRRSREAAAARSLGAVEVLAQQAVKDADAEGGAAGLRPDRRHHRGRACAAAPRSLSLGLEILGVSILAIKPTPDTAKALEAEAREAILRNADEAIFARRNFAVEQERAIRESELDTEIAVEQKKRSIRETQMEAEASVARKQQRAARGRAWPPTSRWKTSARSSSQLNAENTRTLAEAEAYRVGAPDEDRSRASTPRVDPGARRRRHAARAS